MLLSEFLDVCFEPVAICDAHYHIRRSNQHWQIQLGSATTLTPLLRTPDAAATYERLRFCLHRQQNSLFSAQVDTYAGVQDAEWNVQPCQDGLLISIRLRQAERALRESEERYRLLVSSLSEGIIQLNSNGKISTYNQSVEELLGVSVRQIERFLQKVEPWYTLDEQGKALFPDHYPMTITLQTGEPCYNFVMGVPKNHGIVWLSVNTKPLLHEGQRQPYAVVASFTDITAQKQDQDRLLYQSLHDSLTGLGNRQLFWLSLEHSFENSDIFGVLFIDLDDFRDINNTYGHAIGDELLHEVAQRLKRTVRTIDTVCRLGGDEFTIILENLEKPEDATFFAKQVQYILHQPFNFNGLIISITASIGISLNSIRFHNPNDLLKHADQAMYRAKAQGKARYELLI